MEFAAARAATLGIDQVAVGLRDRFALLTSRRRRSAEEHVDWLISHAESHSLGPYLAVARGYKGVLAIGRGDARVGVEDLQGCLEQLHAMRYEMHNTEFKLSRRRDHQAGRDNKDLVHMPEALPVKGNVILSMPQPRARDAEMCFIQSLAGMRLDFLNSIAVPVDTKVEWLASGGPSRVAQAGLDWCPTTCWAPFGRALFPPNSTPLPRKRAKGLVQTVCLRTYG